LAGIALLIVGTALHPLPLHGLLPLRLRMLRLLLPGLPCLPLAFGLLRSLSLLPRLVLPGVGLLSTLFVLGASLVVALFLVVASAMIILCTGDAAHAKRQCGCKCQRPHGLLAWGELHVGTFSDANASVGLVPTFRARDE
jgi:hypothetical protein